MENFTHTVSEVEALLASLQRHEKHTLPPAESQQQRRPHFILPSSNVRRSSTAHGTTQHDAGEGRGRRFRSSSAASTLRYISNAQRSGSIASSSYAAVHSAATAPAGEPSYVLGPERSSISAGLLDTHCPLLPDVTHSTAGLTPRGMSKPPSFSGGPPMQIRHSNFGQSYTSPGMVSGRPQPGSGTGNISVYTERSYGRHSYASSHGTSSTATLSFMEHGAHGTRPHGFSTSSTPRPARPDLASSLAALTADVYINLASNSPHQGSRTVRLDRTHSGASGGPLSESGLNSSSAFATVQESFRNRSKTPSLHTITSAEQGSDSVTDSKQQSSTFSPARSPGAFNDDPDRQGISPGSTGLGSSLHGEASSSRLSGDIPSMLIAISTRLAKAVERSLSFKERLDAEHLQQAQSGEGVKSSDPSRLLTTIASLSYASASVLSRSSSNNQQRAAGAAREQLPGAEALEAAKQLSAANQHTAAAAACGEEAGRKMHAELGKIALALHVGSGLDHGEWGSDGNWLPTSKQPEVRIPAHLQQAQPDDLVKVRELGRGSFGSVWLAKWRGVEVALKELYQPGGHDRPETDVFAEAERLAALRHPCIVAFFAVVPCPTAYAMVVEYLPWGSLKSGLIRLKKQGVAITLRLRVSLALAIACGMEYLHSQRVVHFDLKCDNLLCDLGDLERPVVKVGDLGLSKQRKETFVSGNMRGTLPWMAPELFFGSDVSACSSPSPRPHAHTTTTAHKAHTLAALTTTTAHSAQNPHDGHTHLGSASIAAGVQSKQHEPAHGEAACPWSTNAGSDAVIGAVCRAVDHDDIERDVRAEADSSYAAGAGSGSGSGDEQAQISSSGLVNEKVDVFSYGMVLWEVWHVGQVPYANMSVAEIFTGMTHGTLHPIIAADCDPDWHTLIESCLSRDPHQRPTFTDIVQALEEMEARLVAQAPTSHMHA